MSETAKDGGDSFFAKDSDPLWHSMLMGSLSGAACVIVGHPLDTVKVRLQTSAKGPLFTNLFRGVGGPHVTCHTVMKPGCNLQQQLTHRLQSRPCWL